MPLETHAGSRSASPSTAASSASPSWARAPRAFPEVCLAATRRRRRDAAQRLSASRSRAGRSARARSCRWKSQDGAEIEGVLHKPAGFQRRAALSAAGRRSTAGRPACRGRRPSAATSVYPIDGWLAKGALVLEPNYRGSAGYGEAFRSLNVRNLGIGDAWDVLSGIDELVAQGLVDQDRVGVDGLEPGRLHLGVPDHARRRRASRRCSVGAGHLELDDLLREHRHPPVHAPVPQGDAVGRPGDLRARPRR